MSNKKINGLIMFLILFVSSFFLNIDGVRADTIEGGNGKGYAQCAYKWPGETTIAANENGSTVYTTEYRLIVKVYGYSSNGKNYLEWKHNFVKAGMSSGITSGVDSDEHAYNNEAVSPNNIISKFYVNGQFTCPSKVCYTKPDAATNGNWRWHFVDGDCWNHSTRANLINNSWTEISNETSADGEINASSLSDTVTPGASVASGSVGSDSTNIDFSGGEEQVSGCEMFGGENSEFLSLLKSIFKVMQFAGIGLCIVLSIWDAVTSLVSGEQDRIGKLLGRIVKRLIAVAILLLLPVLIGLILNIMELAGVEDIGGICIDQFMK